MMNSNSDDGQYTPKSSNSRDSGHTKVKIRDFNPLGEKVVQSGRRGLYFNKNESMSKVK